MRQIIDRPMQDNRKLTLAGLSGIVLLLGAITPVPAAAVQLRFAGAEQDLSPPTPKILSLRERAKVRDKWLESRLDTLIPALMREHKIDMWVLIAREYLEDPVVSTMLNAENVRARRRTILVFYDPGDGGPVERLVVSKHGMGAMFEPAWDMEEQPDQWQRLTELIVERNPRKIAVNISSATAFADGMTHSQYTDFMATLADKQRSKVVPGYDLAIGWLETRSLEEMAYYPEIVQVTVPEWNNQAVDFKTEEDAFFDGEKVTYIDGRQTRFHLIGAR